MELIYETNKKKKQPLYPSAFIVFCLQKNYFIQSEETIHIFISHQFKNIILVFILFIGCSCQNIIF
jgi:hypothetical protein